MKKLKEKLDKNSREQTKYYNILKEENAMLQQKLSQRGVKDRCERCKELRKTEEEQIDTRTLTIHTYEDFKKVMYKKWRAQSFAITQVEHGDPFRPQPDNLVVFCDIDTRRQTRWARRALEMYPELAAEEGRIHFEGGCLAAIEQITKTGGKDQEKEEKRRYVIAAYFDPTRQDGRNIEDVFRLSYEVRKWFDDNVEKDVEITITQPQGMEKSLMRKLLEITFRGTSHKITLRSQKTTNMNPERRENRGEAIVIATGSSTYAETLKTLQHAITDATVLGGIKKYKKNMRGDVVLMVENGEKEKVMNSVGKVFNGKEQSVRSANNTRKKTIHIRDVYGVTEQAEVEDALKNLGDITDMNQVLIKPLRPTQRGTQIATVILPIEDANRILKKGTIRIGLNRCRIEERVELERCYRCWAYGHRASTCQGKNRADCCKRCTEKGHHRKDCKNAAICPLCETEGHAAGDGTCRAFREALKVARVEGGISKRND